MTKHYFKEFIEMLICMYFESAIYELRDRSEIRILHCNECESPDFIEGKQIGTISSNPDEYEKYKHDGDCKLQQVINHLKNFNPDQPK
jgi:hypothetical protein